MKYLVPIPFYNMFTYGTHYFVQISQLKDFLLLKYDEVK